MFIIRCKVTRCPLLFAELLASFFRYQSLFASGYYFREPLVIHVTLHKKEKFSIKDFFSKCDPADMVTFTEEILDGKLHFLCSRKFANWKNYLLIFAECTCDSLNESLISCKWNTALQARGVQNEQKMWEVWCILCFNF